MTPPKVVLFDLGRVLVDFDWTVAARRIGQRCALPPAELMDRMMKSALLRRYELGELDNADFFGEVRQVLGYTGNFDQFAAEFSDIFTEIPEMTRLQARVRAAGFPTYVFSNTNDLAVAWIRRRFPFYSNFDGYFLSYELGVMKPAPGIYEAAERTTGCAAGQILYLDDFPENVAAGQARGWQAICHSSPDRTIPRVEGLLFPGAS